LNLSLDYGETGDPSSLNAYIEVWSAHANADIASGSAVTVTFSASNGIFKSAICFSLSGIATTSYVDKTHQNTADSTTTGTTGATATTSQADEVAIGVCGKAASGAPTNTSPYTAVSTQNNSGSGDSLAVEYLVLSSTGAQTATWTNLGNQFYSAVI